VAHAHASHQFLLVYLQSPLHEDTDRFARSVLNDPEVCTFLDRNFVIWAGSVASKEAYQLSMDLQVSTYPYCGVLISRSETQQQLVARLEGVCGSPNCCVTVQSSENSWC
jgi:FAS-associated factor 2